MAPEKDVRLVLVLVQSLLAAPATEDNSGANPKAQEDAWLIFLKANHQLESRILEIWQSGLEGGAKPAFVPTPIV